MLGSRARNYFFAIKRKDIRKRNWTYSFVWLMLNLGVVLEIGNQVVGTHTLSLPRVIHFTAQSEVKITCVVITWFVLMLRWFLFLFFQVQIKQRVGSSTNRVTHALTTISLCKYGRALSTAILFQVTGWFAAYPSLDTLGTTLACGFSLESFLFGERSDSLDLVDGSDELIIGFTPAVEESILVLVSFWGSIGITHKSLFHIQILSNLVSLTELDIL